MSSVAPTGVCTSMVKRSFGSSDGDGLTPDATSMVIS
jgi:hypothetical protein